MRAEVFAGAIVLAFCGLSAPVMADLPPFSPECEGAKAGRTALEANDIAAAEAAYRTIPGSENCRAIDTDWLGQQIAKAKYNEAIKTDPPDEAALTELLAYGRPWQALATLGDLAVARKDHKTAAQRYQEALVEIADVERTTTVPEESVILGLKQKAEQAGLLSPDYVATPRSRDGSNAGLAASEIRGIGIAIVSFPVQFEFDSADFTKAGAEAAADMAGFLKNEKRAVKIVLVGHTDPRGEDDYNLKLSERRATALASYLKGQGVALDISTAGRGESEPYKPDDPSKYSEEERYQMDRRVELRRQR